jgi:outer membrane protein assembly factor BamB
VEWYGPVLAANRLVLASSTGLLITVAPSTGKLLGRVQNRGGFVAPPVIVENTMLLVTENGDLIAYK